VGRVLVLYATTEGQTAKIAEVVAEVLRGRGHATDLADLKTLSGVLPEGRDAVMIGASIHVGKHDKQVVEFVGRNREHLERLPSAFFSVSLAAHGDTQEAEEYVDQFEHETGWHPDKIALFGGALLYTQYGFIKRNLMKKIAKDKPGQLGLDTSRDYVYTEWDAVKRFAEHFAEQIETART
jgi:menaquinone-dependent protoporphyrinogen oxidase